MTATRSRFISEVSNKPEKVGLALAALLIAQEEYPEIDIDAYLRLIESIAVEVQSRLVGGIINESIITILNHCLFEEWGFKGNEFNYYDPDNSFLNKVFDRRLGIPITLSIIYLEVASRLGLDVAGVGFPGHFLVKIMLPSGNYYVDPFNKGRIVTDDLFRELSQSLYDTQADFKPEYIIVVDNHQILRRVLTNLKRIYFREGDLYRGLAVVERLIILSPGEASFYRDRGLLHYGLKEYTKAYQDLRSYLQENPLDEDAKTIRDLVSSIRQRLGSLN